MGAMGLILLLLLVGFGWFAYRELKLMEADILRDIELKNATDANPTVLNPAVNSSPSPHEESANNAAEPASEPDPLPGQLQSVIADQPGIMQTDVYLQLPSYSKKQLQQTLLDMDRSGAIRRVKAKGSYRIYPERS
jgi:hypothetical protein